MTGVAGNILACYQIKGSYHVIFYCSQEEIIPCANDSELI